MTKRLEPIYENVLLDMNPLNWEKTSNPDMSSISFALTSVIKEYESIGYIIEERPHVEIVSSSLKGTDYPECFKANNGVVISLSAKDDYWSQYVYQFAHEYCHYIIGSPMFTRQGGAKESSFWFEESICELASCYFLKKTCSSWKMSDLDQIRSFAEDHCKYYENHVEEITTIDIPLSQWIRDNIESLKETCVDDNRKSYSVIAKSLLPLFLEHPNLWKILPYLKRVDQNTYRDFPHWIKQVVKPQLPTDLSKEFELLENMLVG